MIADDANDFWGLEAIMPMPTKMQIAGDFLLQSALGLSVGPHLLWLAGGVGLMALMEPFSAN